MTLESLTTEHEDESAVKANHNRLFWPILRGTALIVALCAFFPLLVGLLYGRTWGTSAIVFALASFALITTTSWRETSLPMPDDRTVMTLWQRLPWTLVTYCAITGVGYNWVCAVLWFSRRYAAFSGPVAGAMGWILVLYAIIGIVVAWLTRGNWRTALVVFALAPCILSGLVLRLRILG